MSWVHLCSFLLLKRLECGAGSAHADILVLSLEVLRTHPSSLSGPGSASGSGGASAVSNEILTLVFSLVTKVWLLYLHQQNHPMKQPRCLSCSVCWNWTATPSHRSCKLWKGPSLPLLSFRTPISAFSLEARKCILLIQSRLNISFSECSPGSCCHAPPPSVTSEIPTRHCCPRVVIAPISPWPAAFSFMFSLPLQTVWG